MTTVRITEPLLRELVADTVLQALEAGARLPSYFELHLPGKTHREFLVEPSRGYCVRLVLGTPAPTLH